MRRPIITTLICLLPVCALAQNPVRRLSATGAGTTCVPAALRFKTQPANTTPTASFTVTVAVIDVNGTTCETDTGQVNIALATNPGNSFLSGTLTQNAVAGVATFSGLSLNNAANGYVLTASRTGLILGSSVTFDIAGCGSADRLVFTTNPPSNVGQGTGFATTVSVKDAANITCNSTALITLALGNNPGSSTLTGSLTLSAVAGIATFTGLQLNNVGTSYTLVATSSGIQTGTSAAFNITMTGDPTSEPRLTQANFTYIGAFAMPQHPFAGVYDTMAMAYYQPHNSLFVSTQPNVSNSPYEGFYSGIWFSEINILSVNLNTTSYSTFVQNPVNPLGAEGTMCLEVTGTTNCLNPDTGMAGGWNETALTFHGAEFSADNSKLYLNIVGIYNGGYLNHPKTLVINDPEHLSTTTHTHAQLSSNHRVGDYTGGITRIPSEWQTLVGNHDLAMGNCCGSINGQTNDLPSLYGVDSSALTGSGTFVTDTLYDIEGPTNLYQGDMHHHGLHWIDGTRTIVMTSRKGAGTLLYGGSTNVSPPAPWVQVLAIDGNGDPVYAGQGSNASTDPANGCRVTIPGATTVSGDFVLRLTSQSTPVGFIDPQNPTWYPGSAAIILGSEANLGTPQASVSVDHCFTAGLTNQPWIMSPVLVYDPVVCCGGGGFHAYPYAAFLRLYDADDVVAAYGNPALTSGVNGLATKPYAEFQVNFPGTVGAGDIRGAAYDSANKRLFFSEGSGGQLIYVVQLTGF